MNKNAKSWVVALRNGKFTQAMGRLNIRNTYCCLGVACELYIASGAEALTKIKFDEETSYDGETVCLPTIVQEWLGLTTVTGTFDPFNPEVSLDLTYMNDCVLNFNEIADLIESEPEGLFVKYVIA